MRGLSLAVVLLVGTFAALPLPGASVGHPPLGREEPRVRTAAAQTALPAPPAGWPSALQLGMGDGPGGAAAMRATAPFGFRYQYLSGGVNTGRGWATWNTDGQFVAYYVQDSAQHGITPVFTYYQIYQSSPGSAMAEPQGVRTNLQTTATMAAYFADLKLFFQRAAGPTSVVLHVEPDMWGYIHHQASGDDAAGFRVQVAATGLPELAGLPDDPSGLARAIVALRDRYAPNVVLGYHLSVWGTGVDIAISDPSDAQVDALGARAATFYRSLRADFDLAFAEFSDRDSAFKQAQWGQGSYAWWDAEDFRRHARFLATFVSGAQKRVVLWQIPLGNTRMRAVNNTWNHYQDNRVEWLLDDPGRAHLEAYRQAGVVALLFGRGGSGATCACDANNDGVTDPAPINGNDRASLNADDDGGFFREKAAAYYAAGAMPLDGGTPPPPVSCSPRPRVAVTVARIAPGSLQATVAVSGTDNAIRQVRFDPQNASVRTGIVPEQSDPFVLTPQGGTRSLTFTVVRRTPGAVTVPLVVVDGCGEWPTLVGAGPGSL